MSRTEFKSEAFFAALDGARIARSLNWKQVAEQSGVSASTLTRMAQGKRPDVDSLAALVSWSGLSADPFVGSSLAAPSGESLSRITSLLYADVSLSDDSRETMVEMISAAYARSRRAGQNGEKVDG
jgi:transcriptional regulator with XRE-family HTH domain